MDGGAKAGRVFFYFELVSGRQQLRCDMKEFSWPKAVVAQAVDQASRPIPSVMTAPTIDALVVAVGQVRPTTGETLAAGRRLLAELLGRRLPAVSMAV